jgi:hypothetical protein
MDGPIGALWDIPVMGPTRQADKSSVVIIVAIV